MILDRIETYDQFIIYWVHDDNNTTKIEPDDLFYDRYNCLEFIEDKIMSGDITREDLKNYEEEFEEQIEEYFTEYENKCQFDIQG